MFTVLSNTRNSNLYLTVALTVLIIVILSFAATPAISLPQIAAAPVAGASESTSDYFQRHPELRVSAAGAADVTGDFYQRHPELGAPSAAAPLVESLEIPGMACESPVDCR